MRLHRCGGNHIWFCCLVVGNVLLTFSAPSLKATLISIGSAGVAPGSTVSLPVNISGVSDLFAFQFDVLFNPSILTLSSIAEGPFLSSGGTTFFIPGNIDNTAGIATSTADTLIGPVSGVAGSGTLALLNFSARSSGTTPVSLSGVILLDSSGLSIPFAAQAGQVSAVPEPRSTLPLATIAVFLLLIARSMSYYARG